MSGDVEVCIVSYDSGAILGSALTQLSRTIPNARVAVQEHGSDAAARGLLEDALADSCLSIRLREDPSNPGFAAGCNALAAGSSADWLLFLNPDADIVSWPWSPADPPRRDTVLGPEMVGSGDPGRNYGSHFDVAEEVRRSWLRRRGPRPAGRGFVSGAALLVERAVFERIGGFDEGYFMFYEDIDFCLRANAVGVRTEVDPRWHVRHTGAHSTRTVFASSLRWSYESACRFHACHGSSLRVYRTYVMADSGLRAVRATAMGDRRARAAYLQLARRAASDLVRRPDLGRRPDADADGATPRGRPGSAKDR